MKNITTRSRASVHSSGTILKLILSSFIRFLLLIFEFSILVIFKYKGWKFYFFLFIIIHLVRRRFIGPTFNRNMLTVVSFNIIRKIYFKTQLSLKISLKFFAILSPTFNVDTIKNTFRLVSLIQIQIELDQKDLR